MLPPQPHPRRQHRFQRVSLGSPAEPRTSTQSAPEPETESVNAGGCVPSYELGVVEALASQKVHFLNESSGVDYPLSKRTFLRTKVWHSPFLSEGKPALLLDGFGSGTSGQSQVSVAMAQSVKRVNSHRAGFCSLERVFVRANNSAPDSVRSAGGFKRLMKELDFQIEGLR